MFGYWIRTASSSAPILSGRQRTPTQLWSSAGWSEVVERVARRRNDRPVLTAVRSSSGLARPDSTVRRFGRAVADTAAGLRGGRASCGGLSFRARGLCGASRTIYACRGLRPQRTGQRALQLGCGSPRPHFKEEPGAGENWQRLGAEFAAASGGAVDDAAILRACVHASHPE